MQSPSNRQDMIKHCYVEKNLQARLSGIPIEDTEAQMRELRQFKFTYYRYLAACDMHKMQDPIDIPTVMSDITEILLQQIYALSFSYLVHDYHCQAYMEEIQQKIPFAIIAYGRLGAKEMNYASDLDLVFLYQSEQEEITVGNGRVINSAEFCLHLAQRMIHLLSTHTTQGILYEVDVRLRPDGSAGLLVSSFAAYRKYLLENARVWEHQALVKARLVVGHTAFDEQFDALRKEILSMDRDLTALRKEISNMRDKIQDAQRDLKKDVLKVMRGGLSDIQFIAEYMVLRYAKQVASLGDERNTVKILRILAAHQLLPRSDVAVLITAYQYYQALLRRKMLQDELSQEPSTYFNYAPAILAVWARLFNYS